jgi:hypothetical protein
MSVSHIEPKLQPVAIEQLRPTQMTVGMREVERKRRDWEVRAGDDGPLYLGHHMLPAVLGPKHRLWIIDHHHLARALHDEGVEHVLVSIVAHLQHLSKREFLTFMENRNWLHPYDEGGRRREPTELPKRIGDLADDPYRSLASEVRREGGFAKTETPYAEFLWADFFRARVSAGQLAKQHGRVVAKAIDLARSKVASHLPGFSGGEVD